MSNGPNNIPGKSYKRTVLECMMYYPTIFPSEESVSQHLFLGYGTGYGWNTKGQLSYYLGDNNAYKHLKRPERTKDSILKLRNDPYGDKKSKFVCFHSCGHLPVMWTHDLSDNYSPIMFVLRGEVVPNADWKNALTSFCYAVLRPNLRAYRSYMLGYVKLVYHASWKEWFDRDWSNYLQIRKVARKLLNKWYPPKRDAQGRFVTMKLSAAEIDKLLKETVDKLKKEAAK